MKFFKVKIDYINLFKIVVYIAFSLYLMKLDELITIFLFLLFSFSVSIEILKCVLLKFIFNSRILKNTESLYDQ